jgi:hypothetical protein
VRLKAVSTRANAERRRGAAIADPNLVFTADHWDTELTKPQRKAKCQIAGIKKAVLFERRHNTIINISSGRVAGEIQDVQQFCRSLLGDLAAPVMAGGGLDICVASQTANRGGACASVEAVAVT